jgi:omega-hydroxy-beta-dihydromenaquinone-9 sulfotransferase
MNQESANHKGGGDHYPWWASRVWHGMTAGVWWSLLQRHGFRIAPSRLWLVLSVTWVTLVNSVLALGCRAVFRGRRKRARANPDPLVLVGHARSGTTLLHELVVTDPRWGFADTYQCFVPSHWILSRNWVVPWMKHLVPADRPSDGMKLGFELPQEDEFALMNLGAPSPYEYLAFPAVTDTPWVSVEWGPGDSGLRRLWQDTFAGFLRDLALADPRPVVLKSPLHMARIGMILERFPNARFVHIRRNPCRVMESMLAMAHSLYQTQGLQIVPDNILESNLAFYHELNHRFESGRVLLGPGRLHEMTYEGLVADPVAELGRMYAALELEGFDPHRPALVNRVEEMRKFRPRARPGISDADRQRIHQSVREQARRWGYSQPG